MGRFVLKGLQQGGRLCRCKVYYGLLLTSSDPVCHCLLQRKEDAFSQLFKKKERELYSANKLLTLNYSLSSMAQSLLPQFSVLHMKHKIFLSSKPFLIEIGEMAEVRIGPYEVASFGKEYMILRFYFFQDLVLFLLN